MVGLIALLFSLNSFAQDTSFIEQDRIQALFEIADSVEKSFEYKLLEQKIAELENRIQVLENPKDPKKNVMKMIGYSSSTIGLITSIWGIYEKSLSLTNSQTELAIRLNTHAALTSDLEKLKAMEQTPAVKEMIAKKIQIIGELNEKISNIKLRIRISRLGLTRGIFKGFSSVGIFTLTLFIDDIMNWFYSKVSPKHAALSFLRRWNVIVYEAGIIHAKNASPQEKSLFFFADSESLGIPEGEFFKALEIYRKENPAGYDSLRATAIREMVSRFQEHIGREIGWIDSKIDSLKPIEFKYYVAEPDGTKVIIPILK